MSRSLRWAALFGAAVALSGCPRPVGTDAGTEVDSGYEPGSGNAFTGALDFDDERVRALNPAVLRAGPTPCREPFLARVYRITDGDTVHIRGEGVVVDVRLRMIGVDTPELAHEGNPLECYANEATTFTSQLDGRLIYVTFDNECFDTFGRLLGYVHIGAGAGDLWERQLLERGMASAFPFGDNRTYQSQFEADEQEARGRNEGLWGACP